MINIDPTLVSALIEEQFPQWRHLPIETVPKQGWDNRTFRLGAELTVRLPSAAAYVEAVEKEQRVLPFLAAQLPVPTPVGQGRPGAGYPFAWSILRWLPGETVEAAPSLDRSQLAEDLGRMLTVLRGLPATTGPSAGSHSHFRGCHLDWYGGDVGRALGALEHDVDVDVDQCGQIWASATSSAWRGEPAWFHGDVAVGNLLIDDGRLSALIDFGTCGVGDPACDLVMAWTYFSGRERDIFRNAAGLDEATWQRARGWALWKALATMAGLSSPDPHGVQRAALAEILQDCGE